MNEKVKVRIAVAVDHTGSWSCSGWGRNGKVVKDEEVMSFAIESLESGENQYFIEVELERPEKKVISPDLVEKVNF